MHIEENVLLGPFTTFGIGGYAKFFTRARINEELKEALSFAKEKNLKTFILGGGSNVLINDAGFDGLVIKIEIEGVAFDGETVLAGAGEQWDTLVKQAVEKDLWGIENLSGIPGSVGAAPVQNIGAYGQELKDSLAWVDALDVGSGEVKRLTVEDCGTGYRTSFFKRKDGWIVVRVALNLRKNGAPNLSYGDLSRLELRTLPEIRSAVLEIRSKKFPNPAEEGSAGSFFLNPVVSAAKAAELAARFPALPQFPAPDGVKISLAWLLDHALRARGLRVGGARLFEKQPLVVAACKNALASDVRALAEYISDKVKKEFDIVLEPEVRVL